MNRLWSFPIPELAVCALIIFVGSDPSTVTR